MKTILLGECCKTIIELESVREMRGGEGGVLRKIFVLVDYEKVCQGPKKHMLIHICIFFKFVREKRKHFFHDFKTAIIIFSGLIPWKRLIYNDVWFCINV